MDFEGVQTCSGCNIQRPVSHFAKPHGVALYKSCTTCRERSARYQAARRQRRALQDVDGNAADSERPARRRRLDPVLPPAQPEFRNPPGPSFRIHRDPSVPGNDNNPPGDDPLPRDAPAPRRRQAPGRARTDPALEAMISYMLAAPEHMPSRDDQGRMDVACSHCGALHFKGEKVKPADMTFSTCCMHGQMDPVRIPDPPDYLRELLTGDSSDARHYRENVSQYNEAMAFTGCMYKRSDQPQLQTGYRPFLIRGVLYHAHFPLEHAPETRPSYAQTYLYDPEAASGYRVDGAYGPNDRRRVRRSILTGLHQMLIDCGNPFIPMYRTAKEQLETLGPEPYSIYITPQLNLVVEQGSDRRRFNLPRVSEVAVIIPDDGARPCKRNIVVSKRPEHGEPARFHKISCGNAAYFPLAYPVVLPHGTCLWDWDMQVPRPRGEQSERRLTLTKYMRAIMWHYADGRMNVLKQSGRINQKLTVDVYAKAEELRLDWIRHNQKKIRADLYQGVTDHLGRMDGNAEQLGKLIVLPSSVTTSRRFMQQLYQDSMAIVRACGKPTLFVTMTANPNWPEIVDNLRPGATAMDDPVLCATVFDLKRRELMKDLEKQFGRFLGVVWTIEYQKRGLPHCHILLFLDPDERYLDPARIDDVIRAELPSPDLDPNGRLRALVCSRMMHGPCGRDINPNAPCMQPDKHGNLVCSKGFPKRLCEETTVSENGYPLYRRRRAATPANGRLPNGQHYPLGNEWVVPYSPYLLLKYEAHINVEVCASVKAIKYIHKYIYKGDDRTTVALQPEQPNSGPAQDPIRHDEIAEHLNGRYIGPAQAAWHLLERPTHAEEPSVMRLAVHEPNLQPVYFGEHQTDEEVQVAAENSRSTLMAFFEYNARNADGRRHLYHDFPRYYVYKERPKPACWRPRQRGTAIGRMVHVSPGAGERFYIRLLLTKVPGPTSFEDLRTFEGREYDTFKEACAARGFLENDNEWIDCFREASVWCVGRGLRVLFVAALINGDLIDPVGLWERYRTNICDDLQREIERRVAGVTIPPDFPDPHVDYGLFQIAEDLRQYERTLSEFRLPEPQLQWQDAVRNSLIATELDYLVTEQQRLLAEQLPLLNVGQRSAYDTMLHALDTDPERAHFFLQGPGGTGKTFLYSAICRTIRARGEIVLCVASSGIASLLLPGGRTAHSRFKIPIDCPEGASCSITRQSAAAELFRHTRLIIWDEAPMQNKENMNAVHRMLCDVRRSSELFGGDFAQILPVIRRGNRADIVRACMQRTDFWPSLRVLHLTENMRLISGGENATFAEWVGRLPYDLLRRDTVRWPLFLNPPFTDADAFINHVYPPEVMRDPRRPYEFFRHRAIISGLNADVSAINERVLASMVGEERVLHAVDTTDANADDLLHEVPVEYLSCTDLPGLPPSRLTLKVGAPVMLLRNTHPRVGLCNGTRMIVQRISLTCIEVRISGGDFDGDVHYLCRMKLSTNEGEGGLPYVITRKQFPIRLCFAITINKSQGQSLSTVGVDVRSDCFSHGQLYVALSRVTDARNLSVLLRPDVTHVRNVVYPEVLLPPPSGGAGVIGSGGS